MLNKDESTPGTREQEPRFLWSHMDAGRPLGEEKKVVSSDSSPGKIKKRNQLPVHK